MTTATAPTATELAERAIRNAVEYDKLNLAGYAAAGILSSQLTGAA